MTAVPVKLSGVETNPPVAFMRFRPGAFPNVHLVLAIPSPAVSAVAGATPPFTYIDVPFRMLVAFSTPTAGSQQFFASVLGSVSSNTAGGVTFTFAPGAITNIPYSIGPGTGTFDFAMNNSSVNAGQSNAQLTGTITAMAPTVVPEPASMVLLATGLVGVFGIVRRRTHAA